MNVDAPAGNALQRHHVIPRDGERSEKKKFSRVPCREKSGHVYASLKVHRSRSCAVCVSNGVRVLRDLHIAPTECHVPEKIPRAKTEIHKRGLVILNVGRISRQRNARGGINKTASTNVSLWALVYVQRQRVVVPGAAWGRVHRVSKCWHSWSGTVLEAVPGFGRQTE